MPAKKIPFTVYLLAGDLQDLKEAARKENRSASNYAMLALRAAIWKTFMLEPAQVGDEVEVLNARRPSRSGGSGSVGTDREVDTGSEVP